MRAEWAGERWLTDRIEREADDPTFALDYARVNQVASLFLQRAHLPFIVLIHEHPRRVLDLLAVAVTFLRRPPQPS